MPTLFELISPFLIGGISGCTATTFVQPMDTVKVRIQVRSELKGQGQTINVNTLEIIKDIIKTEGPFGFYKGIGAALLRQVTYATTRLGLYRAIDDHYKRTHGRSMIFWERCLASSFSGFVGSIVGNPADLCLVRFQADTLLPEAQRRNYKNVFDALYRIVSEEGLITLWRGSLPTVIRAIAMNLSMLTTYDQIKDIIVSLHGKGKEDYMDKLLSSAAAGIGCAIASLPPDNLKTKLQRMKKDPTTGQFPYKNIGDCFLKTIKREGVTGLWVGLPVFYTRVGPHAMITLLVQDTLTQMWNPPKKKN
ncbi:unnamed protein product [Paramecium primaurelia]|uniref:Mitochondrial 2-oxoglutarate/malate carrier protein n=1 Tax=Paramecium primaurelia TaxID=5886 RepID=A0A8S1P5A9_PARPR|nr:unnamed protein product [Paramecium primaurelia]